MIALWCALRRHPRHHADQTVVTHDGLYTMWPCHCGRVIWGNWSTRPDRFLRVN